MAQGTQLELEQGRLAILRRLDSVKGQAERNRLGQFATPPSLADEIIEYACSQLSPEDRVRFLEPGFGTGSFYCALLRSIHGSRIARALGYEIDAGYAAEIGAHFRETGLELRVGDFTTGRPPRSDDDKPNLIVCNPPYVRHHHLSSEQKRRLQQTAERVTGIRLSQLAGLYCFFLLISHAWLAKNGIAAWLVPSEFMDVNYGARVKQYLLERVTCLRIHRFDPKDVQFDNALVSSAVLILRRSAPHQEHEVEFTFGGTLTQPKASRSVPAQTLRREAKWTRFPIHDGALIDKGEPNTLGDLFRIKRGLATGCNAFFVLGAEKVAEHGLPSRFLTPILPSPRYLKVDEIRADADGEPLIENRQYLLSCKLSESEIKMGYPRLWEYLEAGKSLGIPENYLCQHRRFWYLQEDRPPAPLLCTYMGRQRATARRPFRFILNHSKATAANVYLLLYPRPPLATLLKESPDLLSRLWKALSTITPESMVCEGRVYGGGLHKMEPNELANVPVTPLLEVLGTRLSMPCRQLMLLD